MPNDIYGSYVFEKKFDTMFIASSEKAANVELHFKDFGNIRWKVERLRKTRVTAEELETIPADQVSKEELK